MIEGIDIQPQPLSNLLNRGFQLGGSMFRRVSKLFYLMTLLYFIATHYVAGMLGPNVYGDVFVTFANLSYSFYVMAYFIRIMMKESNKERKFKKGSFLKLFPILFIAGFFYWLAFIAGSVLLIVPGVLFFFYFLFFPSIIAFEQKPLIKSFTRSMRLVRGSFFRVATIYAVFLGMQASAVIIASLLLVSDSFLLTAFVAAIIHIVILPFQATTLNLLYFELRAENEAFDFEVFEYEARRQLTA
ncbi:hypothetical protein GN156_06885 [bacterium LRH843]|nr:hypothetical protein [bacterium LRH843]